MRQEWVVECASGDRHPRNAEAANTDDSQSQISKQLSHGKAVQSGRFRRAESSWVRRCPGSRALLMRGVSGRVGLGQGSPVLARCVAASRVLLGSVLVWHGSRV